MSVCARLFSVGLILLAVAFQAFAKPMDGIVLENSTTLSKGAWDIKFGVEFGSGAEPIEGPFLAAGTKTPIEVDQMLVPLEIRYGMSGRSEIGWSVAYESDKGQKIAAGNNVPGTFLDAGGLQRLRMFGKWKIRPRLSWIFDVAFLGNNALADGNDGFDFGVKFMYGPRIGAGQMLMNAGLIIKGGSGADFNDNGVSAAAEKYESPITFGIGYVYPFTDRFSGIFELAGNTSPFAGGAGFTANDLMSVILGMRYGWADRFFLTGSAGVGVLPGSPGFSFKVGLNWTLGESKNYARMTEESDFWSPTEEMRATVERQVLKPEADDLAEVMAKASDAFSRRDYVSAAAQYEAAVALKKDDPLIHYNLATAYFLLRRYFDAKPAYQNAIRLNPSDVDSHLYLGYTYYYMKNVSEAASEWQTVLNLDPSNTIARDNLASLGVE